MEHSFTVQEQTSDYAILECHRCKFRTSDIEFENAAILGVAIPACAFPIADIEVGDMVEFATPAHVAAVVRSGRGQVFRVDTARGEVEVAVADSIADWVISGGLLLDVPVGEIVSVEKAAKR
ncbi:hypothetical protein [Nocardia sp. NPDC051570]|uniref:hypothetical protein n=1 Tax=Nocardia sp. NPDC051570 TaxID=3364324 RepID=UPI0037BA1FED